MSEPAPAPSVLKVFVIGADPVLRSGIAQYLRVTLPAAMVAEALTDSTGLETVRASDCGVIVLDLSGTGELAMPVHLKGAKPYVPILVLNVDPSPATAQAALAAGAAPYLSKGSPAVETVARGGFYTGV
jgi:DNA-binding NarL/FixJ family response regulator